MSASPKDSDIKLMFAEKTDHASLIQMAGRVRDGLDGFMILYDAPQHAQKTNDVDIEIDKWCLKRIQEFWDHYQFDKTAKDIIEAVEDKFPAIRFDYIAEKFRFYSEREHSFGMMEEDQNYLEEAIRKCVNMDDPQYDADGNIIELSGWQMLEKWFPFSEIDVLEKTPVDEQLNKFQAEFDTFLSTIKYKDIVNKAERGCLVKKMGDFIKSQEGYFDLESIGIKFSEKQPNRFLGVLGYQFVEVGGHHGGGQYKLEQIDSTKKGCALHEI